MKKIIISTIIIGCLLSTTLPIMGNEIQSDYNQQITPFNGKEFAISEREDVNICLCGAPKKLYKEKNEAWGRIVVENVRECRNGSCIVEW